MWGRALKPNHILIPPSRMHVECIILQKKLLNEFVVCKFCMKQTHIFTYMATKLNSFLKLLVKPISIHICVFASQWNTWFFLNVKNISHIIFQSLYPFREEVWHFKRYIVWNCWFSKSKKKSNKIKYPRLGEGDKLPHEKG